MGNTQFWNNIPEDKYKEGKAFYEKGGVSNLDIMPFYRSGVWYDKLTADVLGNNWREYQAHVTVDRENKIPTGYTCNCEYFQKSREMCPHCIAALLRYQEVDREIQKRRENPVPKIKIDLTEAREEAKRVKPTETALLDIFARQNETFQNRFRIRSARNVELVPKLIFRGESAPEVEFAIGRTGGKKYILQNMTEFATLMENGGYRRYGTELELSHEPGSFSQSGAEYAAFIMELVRSQKLQNRADARYFYRNDQQIRRRGLLTGEKFDRFMELAAQSGTIYVETENIQRGTSYKGYYDVLEQKPRLKLSIQGYEQGVLVRDCSVGTWYQGARNEYLLTGDTIYFCPIAEMAPIRSFRDFLWKKNQATYIGEKELPFFVRKMLPQLQRSYDLELLAFDPQKYLPEQVLFRFYLDAPERNIITARCDAVYDTETYVLGDSSRKNSNRDEESEWQVLSVIRDYFENYDLQNELYVIRENDDQIYQLLSEGTERLQELGEVYISDALRKLQIRQKAHFRAGVSIQSDLLKFDIASDEMSMDELAEIMTKYDRKKKYFRLKNGEFVSMEDEELLSMVGALDELHLDGRDVRDGSMVIPKYRAMYLDALGGNEISSFSRDHAFRELIRNMKSVEESDYEVPKSLDQIMRGYQKKGFLWLKTLSHNGFGGILADDMGLGKTLQVIAFLLSEVQEAGESDNRRCLIVCPASLVYNWKNEIERFAPELSVVMVTGQAADRAALIAESTNRDILITSYDLLRRDLTHYEKLLFYCEVVDEAQFIKNQSTRAAHAVRKVAAATKIAMTGTPVENRLSELWSIFDYLMPGFLYGYKQFRDEMEIPIVEGKDAETLERLRRFISPFVLRRLKKDVLKDLPDKMEEVIYVQMMDEQKKIYQANVLKLRQNLLSKEEADFRKERIEILAALTRLRQLCCAPQLILEQYKGGSAKTDQCMDMLTDAVGNGHKVLVFSQFTSMLDILTDLARQQGISYYLLTGATSKERRAEMVTSFNTDDTQVFFISLKAGGTGLNLTAADIVIHYDPWWNVAAQNQATDRTHRIGQKNVVTVYKLIARDTIEDSILALQEHKAQLADQVLGGDEIGQTAFSRQELLEILRDTNS